VRNYLALLGWGTEESQEFFTTDELVSEFSLERVSKSPAVFDEQKLRHMNGRYLRELPLDDLTARLEALTGREGLRGAAEISQEKISTLSDFWPLAGFFFDGPADDAAAREKTLGSPEALERLEQARAALADVPEPWSVEDVEGRTERGRRAGRRQAGKRFQPLRVALAERPVSPGIFETSGARRDETLARLNGGCRAQPSVHGCR
jgi:glutamyl-tRNA synthetase